MLQKHHNLIGMNEYDGLMTYILLSRTHNLMVHLEIRDGIYDNICQTTQTSSSIDILCCLT